jgi:hypothetical protein
MAAGAAFVKHFHHFYFNRAIFDKINQLLISLGALKIEWEIY